MNKIRITEFYNNYEIKEQLEHDLKLLLKNLKITKPFSKYETKTYYDEKTKEYKCEVYNVTKLRVFEVVDEYGKRYLAEINGNNKDINLHFTLMNVQSKMNNSEQVVKIKDIKNKKTINIAKVDQVYGED